MNYKKIIATISSESDIKFSRVVKMPSNLYCTVDSDGFIIELFVVTGAFISVIDKISFNGRMNLLYKKGLLKASNFRTWYYKTKYLRLIASPYSYWSVYDYEN